MREKNKRGGKKKRAEVHSKLTAVEECDFILFFYITNAIWRRAKLPVAAWLHLKRHEMHMAARMTVGPLIENTVMSLQCHEKPFCSLSLSQVCALSPGHPDSRRRCRTDSRIAKSSFHPKQYGSIALLQLLDF